jgi:hypothetical protein
MHLTEQIYLASQNLLLATSLSANKLNTIFLNSIPFFFSELCFFQCFRKNLKKKNVPFNKPITQEARKTKTGMH